MWALSCIRFGQQSDSLEAHVVTTSCPVPNVRTSESVLWDNMSAVEWFGQNHLPSQKAFSPVYPLTSGGFIGLPGNGAKHTWHGSTRQSARAPALRSPWCGAVPLCGRPVGPDGGFQPGQVPRRRRGQWWRCMDAKSHLLGC